MPADDTFILTLRADGPGPPTDVRLRRCLKALLRSHGLRCVSVAPAPPPESVPPRPTRPAQPDRG